MNAKNRKDLFLRFCNKDRIMFLYCLFIKGTMNDEAHNANGDCAICKAWSKKQAIKKFQRLYKDFDESDVSRVKMNSYGIAVLSDY